MAVLSSTAATALVTHWLERRKTNADADHSIVDAATDAVTMVREAHGERIAALEKELATLQRELVVERDNSRKEIVSLNRRVGELMLAAEQQSRNILSLNDEVGLWRSRVSELLLVLRERGLPLPAWADGI